jgi:adenosine/AMP kinase
MVDLLNYQIKSSEGEEVIIGQGNFSLKTVDDIVRVLQSSASGIKVGVAMNDGGMKITRTSGNNSDLEAKAGDVAFSIGAGHAFVAIFKGAYPVNILNDLMNVHGVCNIYVASANPLDVVIAETDQGRAIISVVDGFSAQNIEDDETKDKRRKLLKKIGYHLG